MRLLGIAACVVVLVPVGVRAQSGRGAPTGVKKDIIFQMEDAETKLVALANAIPTAKFAWRPNADVRSVSEVFVHIAAENIAIPPSAGATASATKVPENAEKAVTDKAAIIDLLKKSFVYAKEAVLSLPESQMDAGADYFGTPMSKRGIYFAVAVHGHEHLGQLIAYARSNGIKPPW